MPEVKSMNAFDDEKPKTTKEDLIDAEGLDQQMAEDEKKKLAEQNQKPVNVEQILKEIKIGKIYQIYKRLEDAPQYPINFESSKNGTLIDPVHDKILLTKLRDVALGKWYKIYKNGYDLNKNEISIHYFKNVTGIVFNVKVIKRWSELERKR